LRLENICREHFRRRTLNHRFADESAEEFIYVSCTKISCAPFPETVKFPSDRDVASGTRGREFAACVASAELRDQQRTIAELAATSACGFLFRTQ